VRGVGELHLADALPDSVTAPSTAPLSQVRRAFARYDTPRNTQSTGGSRLSGFYRYDQTGVKWQFGEVTTSNGLGWSPNGRIFYYTDSLARTIWTFDFDPDAGVLSNRQVFSCDPVGYVPDGLTVDVDGAVWAAKWDGNKVVRYRPDGTVDFELMFPVRRPTSTMFVGADLSTLAVTSANLDRTADGAALAGAVFLIPTQTFGLPEARAVVADTAERSPAC